MQSIQRAARALLAALAQGLALLWGLVRPPLVFTFNVIAALIILFEEWGWRPLANLLARLAQFRPFAILEAWVAALPPYPALLVFALPTAVLFPLKLLAVWLVAQGKLMTASALFVGAKIASTAFIARMFMLTKPALMRIGWFARAYNWFVPWKEHLFGMIRASWVWRYGRIIKTRIKQRVQRTMARFRPQVLALRTRLGAAQRQITQWLKKGTSPD